MNKAAILVYGVLLPGKVGAVTFSFGLNVHICSWISTACYCLPDTVSEHRTLAYKESARAHEGGVSHLRFGFPLPFCQLACLTATLLSSFAKEQEIGH